MQQRNVEYYEEERCEANIIPDLAVFKRDYAQEVKDFMEIFWMDDF